MKVAHGFPTARSYRQGYTLTRTNALCLGVVIVWGGFYSSWNITLAAGIGSSLIAFFIIGTAYVQLCECIATISSVIPFSGGAYGLALCSLGFYPGFVVGCCEVIQYVIFVAIFVSYTSDFTCALFPSAEPIRALIWICTLASCVFFQLFCSKRSFHRFVIVLAVVEVLALVVYVLGAIKYTNFYENALIVRELPATAITTTGRQYLVNNAVCTSSFKVTNREAWFIDGFSGFFRVLPYPAVIHIGIEALNMAANETRFPKRDVPFAQIVIMRLIFAFSMAIVFLVGSVSPGTQCMSFNVAPLNPALMLIVDDSKVLVWLLSMPAIYGTAFGFVWAYSKMIQALNESSFFPGCVMSSNADTQNRIQQHTPLLLGALLCFVINIAAEFSTDDKLDNLIMNLGMLFALVAYCSQCVGYLLLSSGGTLELMPVSSYRRAGALFSIVIWILMAVGVMGYQDDEHLAAGIFGLCLLVISCYYYAYGKRKQTLSNEEKKYFYAIHMLNCKGTKVLFRACCLISNAVDCFADAKRNNRAFLISKILSDRAHRRVMDGDADDSSYPIPPNIKRPEELESSDHLDGANFKSGIVQPAMRVRPERNEEHIRVNANSSVANNDSKEIGSKAAPIFEWMLSGADMQIIENEIRKDEESERLLMAGEDKLSNRIISVKHDVNNIGRQQYHLQQLELLHQFSRDPGPQRHQQTVTGDSATKNPADNANLVSLEEGVAQIKVDKIFESDCKDDKNEPAPLVPLTSVPSSSMKDDPRNCVIIDPYNNLELRVNPQQRQNVIELRMIQSESSIPMKPTVRPAILTAIEHDMHGYAMVPTLRRLANFAFDMRQSVWGAVWGANQVTPE
jgi:ethanolamine permease